MPVECGWTPGLRTTPSSAFRWRPNSRTGGPSRMRASAPLIAVPDLGPEGDDFIGEECADVGQAGHIGELNRWPEPSAGFASHHGNGRHALHRKGEEYQQCDSSPESKVLVQGLLQALLAASVL